MTATAHALIGAAIAVKIPNPAISIPLAFISHFLCDKVPHWDIMTGEEKVQKKIILQSFIDVVLGFTIITAYIYWGLRTSLVQSDQGYLLNVYLSALVAQLPDWLEVPNTIFGFENWVFKKNYEAQKWIHDVWFNARLKAPWGIITQIIVVVVFWVWTLK